MAIIQPCTEENWSAYRKARNEVNKMIKSAHERYRTRILDTSFPGQQRQFWKYIKAMKKSSSSIPSLSVGENVVTDAKEKATALNKQFQSVFTVEDLTNVPEIGTGNLHAMQPIQISETGIQTLLHNLETNKAPGPDGIESHMCKW